MPTRASWGSGRPPRHAAVAGLVLAALLAGCGDDGSGAEEAARDAERESGAIDISGTEPVGEETAGSVAQLAECRDWNEGTDEQKLATIADVRGQLNPADSGVDAPSLTDDEALELFDNACAADYAQGFRLYKLYASAVGFAPLARRLDEAESAAESP